MNFTGNIKFRFEWGESIVQKSTKKHVQFGKFKFTVKSNSCIHFSLFNGKKILFLSTEFLNLQLITFI